MFKFNETNTFTGYLKQLLTSFNLPKYRVYTSEQRKYHEDFINNYQNHLNKIKALEEETALLREIINDTNNLVTEAEKTAATARLAEARKELLAEQKITPELNVLPTIYRNDAPEYKDRGKQVDYPKRMRYIPYIKDGKIQEYSPQMENGQIVGYSPDDWKVCHAEFGKDHDKLHIVGAGPLKIKGYYYGIKDRNYTKKLKIQNNIYDSYTHEYLGDYLRFQRDFRNINLMPLYNCFSNRVCPRLDISFKIDDYTAKFNTEDKHYKIYMVPIKLFKQYTIAIDSGAAVEMCCGLYGQYQEEDSKYLNISKNTYMCFSNMQFRTPVLYTKVENLNEFLTAENETELAQQEEKLKLFIKLPANVESSIVVLEGDYTAYNDTMILNRIDHDRCDTATQKKFYAEHPEMKVYSAAVSKYLIKPFVINSERRDLTVAQQTELTAILAGIPNVSLDYYTKVLHGTLPREYLLPDMPEVTADMLTKLSFYVNELYKVGGLNDKLKSAYGKKKIPVRLTNHTVLSFDGDYELQLKNLITPLQLLRTNTGISYPFADRLIEYLVGNAITPADEIYDNIERAKVVTIHNTNKASINLINDGLWVPGLQLIYYNYINENHNVNDINHDILGFVDKDVEKYYADKAANTISSINIYDGINDTDKWED